MAGMVVTAATGVMSSLLSKLSVLLSDKYKQLKGVRRDIKFLSDELTDMNAALEKLAGMDKLDCQRKVWRDKVREMAYDIEDVIDIFMHHLDKGDDDDSLFHKTARKIRKLRVRYQLADKIQEIKARVEEQSKSRERYKIDESVSEPRVLEVDPRLPAMYEDAKRLVGIDGPTEEITKLLMGEGDSSSRQLKVLSIVGFGGLGKTTLANQVYSNIKNKFECTAFVSVSRTPHMTKILKDILSEIGYRGTEEEDDVPKLIKILRAMLMNKRYFIIIDDLWSIEDWLTIECAFAENNSGSRIITTTRSQDVATASCFRSQGHVYQIQPLNELHSRKLFIKRIFDTEDGCPEQFREILDDMLRKCRGVPLAITSIASLLANHLQLEIWEKILNSLGSELDTNPTLKWMRHVLDLSYNDLSPELKTCFLYLGTYPEDSEIRKDDLVRKWIAEGFIKEKHGLDIEEVAENYFNELINRSMIQPSIVVNFDQVHGCQVHDLMLDLVISKCKEENFITIIDKMFVMNGASQVRRISHQFHSRDMAIHLSTSASQVRSYTSFNMPDCMPPLAKFELLRVLDMKGPFGTQEFHRNRTEISQESVQITQETQEFPAFQKGPKHRFSIDPMCLDLSAVNHLFLLRYLRVTNYRVEMPKKFGKLKHLLTLHISLVFNYGDGQPISDISSLSSLRHLSLPDWLALKNGFGKLRNLRDLSFGIRTNSVECIRDLGELTNLRNLQLECGSYSRPGGVEDNSDTILASSLNKLGNSNLRSLEFLNHSCGWVPSAQFWSNCLARPQHLQKLYFLAVTIPKVPNWIAHADRLAYLDELQVEELRSDDIQVLARLPCLINLRLIAKTVPEKNITFHPNTFPSLKFFVFFCELSCVTFEPAAMPRLQRLGIILNGCSQGAMQVQEGSPVGGIEHLASLVHIRIIVEMPAKYDHAAKTESACRDAISRHPNSQAMQVHVKCYELPPRRK